MDEAAVIRIAVTVGGVVGTLAVTLLGVIIRRLYKSNDVLFYNIGRLEKRLKVLELVAVKNEPDSTGLFRALTNGNGQP